MDALEYQVCTMGTVASVFARTITQSQLTKKIGADVLAAMEDIFQGNENPDPGAVTKALQPETARAWAYLVVVNLEVGFTLLHHLQRMDQEIQPGDPIVNRIVAFEGDIRPQGFTPNVVVFNKAEDTLFQRFNLPSANLVGNEQWYSSQANGNDRKNTFLVDPAITVKANGAVTRLIPIPLEWAPMFIDGPHFEIAFRRIFDLYDSLDEDDRSDLYPIVEMIGMACCAADTSDMAPSTISTQWTRLTYPTHTKRWATEAWAKHSEPVEQAHSDQDEHLSLAERAPLAHLNNLCGQRQKRQPREPAWPAMEHDSHFIPAPHGQPAKAGMEGGDLGFIMVKILEAQAEASLRLHQTLLKNCGQRVRP